MNSETSFPTGIHPMLATSGDAFDSPNHIFEVKWDGIRALAYKHHDTFWMETRNLKPALPRFPEFHLLREALKAKQVILDGEIVIFDENGRPDFDRVRSRNAQRNSNRIAQSQKVWPATFIAFDCLFHDGENMMPRPLWERRQRLESVVDSMVSSSGLISAPAGSPEHGSAFLQATRLQGLEGMVAKHRDSPYRPGVRSQDWIKVRNVRSADCVIGGYVPKDTSYFKSLLLGLYDADGNLHYMGNVGTGFRVDEIATLRHFFDRHLTTSQCPFIPGSVTQPPPIHWTKPTVVCTIKFLTLTKHHHFRHATFRGLRHRKNPRECTLEAIA